MEQLIERFETLGADVALFAARYVEEHYIEGQMVSRRALPLRSGADPRDRAARHGAPYERRRRPHLAQRDVHAGVDLGPLGKLVLAAGNMPRVRERNL